MSKRKCKVLLFAEGATLAHVGRPYVLAKSLDPAKFEVTFARPHAFAWLSANAGFRVVDLACQASSVFARRLEWGQPIYDYPTLERYVADDLALIEAERPDVIVGDFRLSLSVSARLAKIPYITVCDAYWSPELPLDPMLPVMRWTPYVPLTMTEWAFKRVAPVAMGFLHTAAMERLRAHHGLPSLRRDIRLCYTDADLRLFANPRPLFPTVVSSPQCGFLGPVAWSPEISAPPFDAAFFDESPSPLIYVTMGSSGDSRVLQALLPLLADTGAWIIVATAGKPIQPAFHHDKVRYFDFLPGRILCEKASLVVCNGGSPTTNQALASGTPVIGIATNMDQFLNMAAIQRFGAGIVHRSDRATPSALSQTLQLLWNNQSFTDKALSLAHPNYQPDLAQPILDLLSGRWPISGSTDTSD